MYNRAYCLHHLGMKDRVLKELCNALQAATQLSLPHPHYNIFASSASQYQVKLYFLFAVVNSFFN